MAEQQNKEKVADLNSFRSKKKNKKPKKSLKVRILRIFLICFLVGVLLLCIAAAGVFIYVSNIDDDFVLDLEELRLDKTTAIYVQDENDDWVEYQRFHGAENRIWVSYDEIPQDMKDAFVAVEDKRFFQHGGVDWKRTISAFANYFLHFYSSNQGGSTITQQLIKNITGETEQTPERKIKEIMRARRLEKEYTKETILECYMNVVSMANNISGVEVASNFYFNKHVSDLTLSECAALAGITQNPEKYRPDINLENTIMRRDLVLSLMLEQGYITQEEHDSAKAEKLNIVADKANIKQVEINSYFVDALIEQVITDLQKLYGCSSEDASLMFYNNGYQIYATIDTDIQERCEEVFENSKKYGLKSHGETLQGAITVMDYEGHIVGIAGGIGEKTTNRGFNRATMAARQPGSTMKPIAAYAQAVEKNLITYSTALNDNRRKFGSWAPNNWYGGNKGYITAHFALEYSVNTIPTYLVNDLKPSVSYNFLKNTLGCKFLTNSDANLAPLGMGGTNGGLSTTQSAAAYAIFGNLGVYHEPTTYYYITDSHGNIVIDYDETGVQAIGEDTATVMNYMLRNVVYGSSGTGRGAGSYVKGMKIFAKTGTSNNTNDLWFVGGSPYYVASCWTGYDNNYSISSSSIAMRMWGAVMSDVHDGLKAKKFEDSKYVSKRYYCADTGLLATTECPNKAEGWYKNSYLPTCSHHGGTILGPIVGSSATFSGKSGVVKGKVTGMLVKEEENPEDSSSEDSGSSDNSGVGGLVPGTSSNTSSENTTQ